MTGEWEKNRLKPHRLGDWLTYLDDMYRLSNCMEFLHIYFLRHNRMMIHTQIPITAASNTDNNTNPWLCYVRSETIYRPHNMLCSLFSFRIWPGIFHQPWYHDIRCHTSSKLRQYNGVQPLPHVAACHGSAVKAWMPVYCSSKPVMLSSSLQNGLIRCLDWVG